MRFLALLKKELIEVLGFGIAQLILVSLLCFIHVRWFSRSEVNTWYWSCGRDYHLSPLTPVGPVLLVAAILLGLGMGIRHFRTPQLRGTWPFILHRSVTKGTILLSKITAAILTFIVFTGGSWTFLYWYASVPGLFILPPTPRVYIEGWFFIALGFIVYLAIGLSGIKTTKWYSTRMLGVGIAAIVVILTFCELRMLPAFVVVGVGFLILVSQLYSVFVEREF